MTAPVASYCAKTRFTTGGGAELSLRRWYQEQRQRRAKRKAQRQARKLQYRLRRERR